MKLGIERLILMDFARVVGNLDCPPSSDSEAWAQLWPKIELELSWIIHKWPWHPLAKDIGMVIFNFLKEIRGENDCQN